MLSNATEHFARYSKLYLAGSAHTQALSLVASPGTGLLQSQLLVLFHTVFADTTVAYEKRGENVKKQQFNWACSDTEFQFDDVHQ